jgi:hypothetical protein
MNECLEMPGLTASDIVPIYGSRPRRLWEIAFRAPSARSLVDERPALLHTDGKKHGGRTAVR